MYRVSLDDLNDVKSIEWVKGSPEYIWLMVRLDGIRDVLKYFLFKKNLRLVGFRADIPKYDNIILSIDYFEMDDTITRREVNINPVVWSGLGKYEWEEDELWRTIFWIMRDLYGMRGEAKKLGISVCCAGDSYARWSKLSEDSLSLEIY